MSHFTILRAAVALLCSLTATSLCVAEAPKIVRVEEYWELKIASTDQNSAAPQVSCTLSPQGDLAGHWVTFELNHRTLPAFSAGGMQMQLWNNEEVVAQVNANEHKLLSQANETITWTQSMELSEGQLTFSVTDGQSTSWGPFGNNGQVNQSVATTLTDLGGYDPTLSVENSGAVLAANRVESMKLLRFRLILEDGQIFEDATARVVLEGDNDD